MNEPYVNLPTAYLQQLLLYPSVALCGVGSQVKSREETPVT